MKAYQEIRVTSKQNKKLSLFFAKILAIFSLKLLQITGDFCSWLRELPEGEDQTVNNLTPEKIKSLFDSTNSSKLATSKVAEGLRSS